MGRLLFGSMNLVPKRVPQDIDNTEGIARYGSDNLYPQRMEQIALRSPLTKQCIETLADFINGDGWTNEGMKILNRAGQTADDLLLFLSRDYATFNGFAIHLNFDGNGAIVELQYLPFEFVRFGEPKNDGTHDDVKVSNNWEENRRKLPEDVAKTVATFPLFNPRTAQLDTIMEGMGQVLYWTGDPDNYPLTTFDAVATSSQLEDEIQIYGLNNTVSGFLGTSLFKYPGDLGDEESEAALTRKVNAITGSKGPGMMILEVDEDFTGNIIENLPADNKDALFVNTFQQTRDMIIQNYAMPKPLVGVTPQNTVFTQQQIADSYRYFNIRTKNRRNAVERVFTTLGAMMVEPTDFGVIKAQIFATEQQDVVATNPPAKPEGAEGPEGPEGGSGHEEELRARMQITYGG